MLIHIIVTLHHIFFDQQAWVSVGGGCYSCQNPSPLGEHHPWVSMAHIQQKHSLQQSYCFMDIYMLISLQCI